MKAATDRVPQILPRKLYSYVVTHDTGFSPNPFFGYCTLACCKPTIRRIAREGDWVIGLSPKRDGNRIVYFMQVDEILPSFAEYWRDRRFTKKKPELNGSIVAKCGDNIYKPLRAGEYRQLPSMHSKKNGEEDPVRKAHDLKGERVLVSESFAFFGATGPSLPPQLISFAVGRGHRSRFPDRVKAEFLQFVKDVGLSGLNAAPRQWRHGDVSWLKSGGGCGI